MYEQSLQIPYYIVYDRYQNQLRVFQLTATRYQAVEVAEQKFWLTELELGLGVWSGSYQQTEGLWLRWYDATGNWIATPEERAERLAERLRSLGVNPDEL